MFAHICDQTLKMRACSTSQALLMLRLVKARSAEFLNLLLWTADQLMRPTFRNLTDSYESWAYRKGLLGQLHRLERRRWIERKASAPKDRIYRLTEEGRLHVLGGRDPEQRWTRFWDGQWRMVLFDLPLGNDAQRRRLWSYLRDKGFGYLQNSVWITPDPLEKEREFLARERIDVESLILLDARPCADETDEQIVAGAWDFERINNRYTHHLNVLKQRPSSLLRSEAAASALQRWAGAEHEAWLNAVTKDPLLPQQILPSGYLGKRAWQRRKEVLHQAGQQIGSFRQE
jgi:phenylacetic acid degradation operon negative regulatory protein